MAQDDPFAKWRKPGSTTIEEPKADPFAKWKTDTKPIDSSVRIGESFKLPETKVETEEEENGILSKIWDAVNYSILPDLPEERLINPNEDNILNSIGRYGEEI